jgi:cysteinyl-tRNA synthetase
MIVTLGRHRLAMVSRARVYICGITPYEATHLGHATTFVWSDVAVRLLRRLGLEVLVTRNITDVDDALVARARELGASWRSMAVQQTYRFEEDMARLGVLTPTFEPQAHNYVDEVIALAQGLLDLGRAYERDRSVYFPGAAVAAAAHLGREEALELLRDHGGNPDDPAKADPLDVPLWQRSTGDEPGWPSPWGTGRPGWHAECTAMALGTLGPGIDLHCGGADLAYPHHAFEAAHGEALLDVAPFARAWVRAGIVRHQGEKMAKSTGNLVFVHDVLAEHSPAALRLSLLERRWWDDWDYAEELVAAAEERVVRLRHAVAHGSRTAGAFDAALAALCDDLDVPAALAVAEDAGGEAAELVIDVLGLRHREHVARTSLIPSP